MMEVVKIMLIVLFHASTIQPAQQIQEPFTPIIEYVDYSNISESVLHKTLLRSNGENGFNNEALFLTTCTILNRLHRGYGNGQIDNVLNVYYAPDVEYNKNQYEYVSARINQCPKSILYALSYNDINYLNFPLQNADYIVGSGDCENYNDKNKTAWRCAYFYSRWQN